MKQTMDRCQGSTEVMALGGYDQESLRKGVDVLCKDVNRKWSQIVFYILDNILFQPHLYNLKFP